MFFCKVGRGMNICQSARRLTNVQYLSQKTKHTANSPDISKRLDGKVAVITGSTTGIGYSIADRLGAEGATVVVSSRNPDNVSKAVESLKSSGRNVLGLTCHVSDPEQRKNLVQKTIENFGGIDIFVASSGVNPAKEGLLQCSESVWDKIFEVNLKNNLQMTQLIAPHMIEKKKGGAIVYISSVTAKFPQFTSGFLPMILPMSSYAISKCALEGFTTAMAYELANHKIRVNCVRPGIVDTKFGSVVTDKEVKEITLKPFYMNRFGEPHEIAAAVAFLCSEDASYITAETLTVGGGMS